MKFFILFKFLIALTVAFHNQNYRSSLENKFVLFNNFKDEAFERGESMRFAPKGRSFGHEDDARYLEFGRIWYERLQQLREFKDEHGHTNVPELYEPNPQLGHWVFNQRKEYSKRLNSEEALQDAASSITTERIEALNEIGFVWSMRKKPARVVGWSERYQELLDYKEKYGDCDVPQTYNENLGLARWVNKMRNQYKRKSRSLKPEYIDALDSIGFSWSMYDKLWEGRYLQLKQFYSENGHTNITSSSQLGSWAKKQQQEMKKLIGGRKSALTDARIAKLNEIGFRWDDQEQKSLKMRRKNNDYEQNIVPSNTQTKRKIASKNELRWQERFIELLKFKEEHGHCNVPVRYIENLPLGKWVDRQRQNYKKQAMEDKDQLSADRINQLEDIGFEWNLR